MLAKERDSKNQKNHQESISSNLGRSPNDPMNQAPDPAGKEGKKLATPLDFVEIHKKILRLDLEISLKKIL
jgi:hypothetical protein